MRAVLAVLCVGLLVAGCAEPGSPETPDASAPSASGPGTGLPAQPAARSADGSAPAPAPSGPQVRDAIRSAAFASTFEARPGGALAAYRWVVPGPVEAEAFRSEMRITVHGDAALEAWGAMAFLLKEDGYHPVGGGSALSYHYVERFPVPVLPQASDLAPAREAGFVAFPIKEGAELGIVLFAATDQATAVTIEVGEKGAPAALVEPLALGLGIQVAHYSDFGVAVSGTSPVIGEAWTAAVQIDEAVPNDLRPMQVRDVTFTATSPSEAGASFAAAVYVCDGPSVWSVEGTLRGAPLSGEGTAAGAFGVTYAAQNEGTGTSTTAFSLTTACPSDPLLFVYLQTDLGTGLAQLLGQPAAPLVTIGEGLPGPSMSRMGPAALPGYAASYRLP